MLGPDIDQKLIDLLKADARRSTTELARTLGISRSTVQSRIKRLEDSGTILGYTVQQSPATERNKVMAHVSIRVSPKHQASVERALGRMTAIGTLYTVSGDHDLIAIVRADGTAQLDRALDSIRDTEGVIETKSAIVLSTRVAR